MKDSFIYLKNLFYNKDQKLSKKDFVTIASIMWMISSLTIGSLLFNVPYTFLATKKGVTFLASHNIFSSFSSLVFNIGIPWFFIALVLSILLANKLYGNVVKRKFLIIIRGFFLWMFFSLFPLLPLFFLNISELYVKDFLALEKDILLMKVFLGVFTALGGFLFFKSLLKASSKEIIFDSEKSLGLGRGKFSRNILYLQFVPWLLSFFSIKILLDLKSTNLNLLSYIMCGLFVIVTIIQLYFMAQRLINMGKSPLILFAILLLILLLATMIFLLTIIESVFLYYLVSKLIGILIITANLFYVLLFLYPGKKAQGDIELFK